MHTIVGTSDTDHPESHVIRVLAARTPAEVLAEHQDQEFDRLRIVRATLAKALPGVRVCCYLMHGIEDNGAAGICAVTKYRAELGESVVQALTLERMRNMAFAEVTRVRDENTQRKLLQL